MLRTWNVTLVASAFLLSIFSTFITRSDAISSVNSFAQSPAGKWLAGFLILAIAVTAYLVSTRLRNLGSTARLESVVSREAGFLYDNLLLESRAIALPRLVTRNRRRYGGYIAHLGLAVVFAGFAGVAFKREFDMTLNAGDTRTATDAWGHSWTFLNQGISRYDILNREVTAIVLDVTRDGTPAGVITSEKRQYVDSRGAPTFQPSTAAGIMGSFRQDVYVVLAVVRGADAAEIRVTFNPLVRWVWLGGSLMAVGGLVVMWPAAPSLDA